MMRAVNRQLSVPVSRVSWGRLAVPDHNPPPWTPLARSCPELFSVQDAAWNQLLKLQAWHRYSEHAERGKADKT
jgi:hypothetical protein